MSTDTGEDRLREFSGHLARQTGLYFPKERFSDLKRGISNAARQSGSVDAESYLKQLLAEPLTKDRIKMLTPHLTVGETYFFRDPVCFDFLETIVLPNLIRLHQETRTIRIWCAGCSSGEEPYSVAMLLERLLTDIDTWTIFILATDINPSVLSLAREGIYGAWSLRDVPDMIRKTNFSKVGEKKWKINEQTKRRVTFAYHNLVTDPFPSLVNGLNAMDLILCRNVLMYLSEESAQKIATQFSPTLHDDGWLVFSPAETSLGAYTELAPVHFHGQTFFRQGGTIIVSPPLEIQASSTLMKDFVPEPYLLSDTTPTQPLMSEITELIMPPVIAAEADPATLIDMGLCAEAAVLLEKRILTDPLSNNTLEPWRFPQSAGVVRAGTCIRPSQSNTPLPARNPARRTRR
jgi:chemotaxis methyl-accepting protein methylase